MPTSLAAGHAVWHHAGGTPRGGHAPPGAAALCCCWSLLRERASGLRCLARGAVEAALRPITLRAVELHPGTRSLFRPAGVGGRGGHRPRRRAPLCESVQRAPLEAVACWGGASCLPVLHSAGWGAARLPAPQAARPTPPPFSVPRRFPCQATWRNQNEPAFQDAIGRVVVEAAQVGGGRGAVPSVGAVGAERGRQGAREGAARGCACGAVCAPAASAGSTWLGLGTFPPHPCPASHMLAPSSSIIPAAVHPRRPAGIHALLLAAGPADAALEGGRAPL